MDKPNWKSITELIGLAAIIVGLYFVYVELRQASAIARAEMSTVTNEIFNELDTLESDSDFASTLVTANNNPENLTEAERTQLNGYFRRVLTVYSRELYFYRRGIFPEWKSTITRTAPRYFGSGYGRSWWNVRRTFFISNARVELASEVDRALENTEAVQFYGQFDSAVRRQISSDQP